MAGLLDKIEIEVGVVLGGRTLRLGDALGLGRGAFIDLETLPAGEVELCGNGHAIAAGRLLSEGEGPVRLEISRLFRREAGRPVG